VVLEGYLEKASNFTFKIHIKHELGKWMHTFGGRKSNVMVHEGYLEGDLNFTKKNL